MRYKIVFTILLASMGVSLFGQTTTRINVDVDRERINSDHIEGSPYMYEEWFYGDAYDSEGNVMENIQLRYNMEKDLFETLVDVNIVEMNKHKYNRIEFSYVDDKKNEVKFNYANYLVENDPGYYHVLYWGNNSAYLKKTTCKMIEKRGTEYNRTEGYYKYVKKTSHYIKYDGELKKIKKNSKSIINALGGSRDFEKAVKKNKWKLKNDVEIILALENFEGVNNN